MARDIFKQSLIIFFVFFFSFLFSYHGKTQTSISGIVNSYIDVTGIIDADELTVSDASDFSVGDTVLLIQMKGLAINNTNDLSFGSRQQTYSAGKYEIIIIASISGTNITLASDMTNSYDANGHLQMVRIPGYDNATVTGNITCPEWDIISGTGGVVALIVGNKLSLEADIDVTGKGFGGAEPYTTSDVLCTENSDFYFSSGSDSAGYKGEGIASYALDNTNPLNGIYAKGRGAYFNGGGGGNGKYSGGGGGANGGSGGLGGKQWEPCGIGLGIGGIGGRAIPNEIGAFDTQKLIFMGGGGGASTQLTDGDGTTGGNGGGIIIIMADTIIGNGHYIKANGETVVDITNDTGGAGGGGAGGTILLDVKGYKSSTLNVQTSGGNGGSSGAIAGSCTGPGGGGGGGIIWYSHAVLPSEVNLGVNGGTAGSGNCFLWGQSVGNPGTTVPDLKVPLTGFLFNSIFSIQSEALNDTICEEDILPKLLGTEPRGGTTPYQYKWESSNNNLTWNIDLDYGAGGEDYNPLSVMIDTTYYRRTVKDNSVPVIVDISKTVAIIVQPKIEQNSLNFDTIVCLSQTPNKIIPEFSSPIGGNDTYFYLWEQSTDGITFTDAPNVKNTDTYQPPVLSIAQTYYYRRIVSSGNCSHISDTATITVLPLAPVNITDQTICDGDSILWQENYYKTEGTYYVNDISDNGCNSIYQLNLTVNSSYHYIENEEICDGDSLIWQEAYYKTTGQYFANYQTINSCDSIYELNLIVNPSHNYTDNEGICSGDSLFWRVNYYKYTGTYYDSLLTVNGCDSIYELKITVNPAYYYSDNEEICQSDSLLWHGNYFLQSGIYYDTLETVIGCDSIYELNLIVNSFNYPYNEEICDGDSLLWQGTYYKTEGLYFENYQTINGCDSIYELNLTVNPTPFVSISDSTNISCSGYSDGSATVTVSGVTAPYTYQWDDNENTTNSTVTGLPANVNYHVIVTDANSCTATNSVILSEPLPLSINSDYSPSICLNSNTGYVDISVSGGTFPYFYNWSNAETTEDIENLVEGNYSVTIIDNNGCNVSDSFSIDTIKPFEYEEICLVTVDTSGKNMIIWEKTSGKGTEFYNIYRESNVIGEYDLIGTAPYNDLSIFIDTSSTPRQRSYQYKISVIDSCSNESTKSYYHRTMLLKLNVGINAYNLDWDIYEYEGGGFTFDQYNIYRGTSKDSLVILYTIGGNYDSYVDDNPPSGMLYYQVGGVKESGCNPTSNMKGLLEDDYTESLSNIEDSGYTGIEDIDDDMLLNIYPNPFSNSTTIEFPNPNFEEYQLIVTDISGKVVRLINNITVNKVSLYQDNLSEGFYLIELQGPKIYRGKILIQH